MPIAAQILKDSGNWDTIAVEGSDGEAIQRLSEWLATNPGKTEDDVRRIFVTEQEAFVWRRR